MTKYYSIAAAAPLVGTTVKGLRARIARGEFPYRRLGRRILVPADQLEIFLKRLPGQSAEAALARVGDMW